MRLVRIAAALAVCAAIVVPTALALAFSDDPLPTGVVSLPYSFQLTARNGCPPYTFSVGSGSLPPGIGLSSSGLLSGTPTTTGLWSFYLDLGDSCASQHSQKAFTLEVIPKLTVTTHSLDPSVVGVAYSKQLTYEGGGVVTWSVSQGSPPAGITLSPSGLLSGTPTTVGTSTFQVFLKDTTTTRTDTQTLTLEVLAPLAATVGTAPAAEAGIVFKGLTPAATGGKAPYAWSLAGGSLPAGLSVDPATGAINGTPAAAGTFLVKLGVKDSIGLTASADATVVVAPKVAIATKRLAPTKVGQAYQVTLRTRGGVQPTKWKVTSGRFPVGIRFDRKTGLLSGTPRTAGDFTITFTVTDKLGATAEQTLTLTVKPKPKPPKS